MTKFEQYLEAVRNVVINEGSNKVKLLIDKLEELDYNTILTGDLLKEVRKIIKKNSFLAIKPKQRTVGKFLSILNSDEYYDFEDY